MLGAVSASGRPPAARKTGIWHASSYVSCPAARSGPRPSISRCRARCGHWSLRQVAAPAAGLGALL